MIRAAGEYPSIPIIASIPLYVFSAPRGIGRVEGNRLVDIGPNLDLLNMAEFRGQELWFSAGHGIYRFPTGSDALSLEGRSAVGLHDIRPRRRHELETVQRQFSEHDH